MTGLMKCTSPPVVCLDPLEPRFLLALSTVSIGTTSLKPAREGSTIREFLVHRTGSTSKAVAVNLAVGGVAKNGLDYGKIGSIAIIPAGTRNVVIKIRPVDDKIVEHTEAVTLTVTASKRYRVSSFSSATIRIKDNDSSTGGLPAVSVQATTGATEGGANGSFAISRAGSTAFPLPVNFSISGSAVNGTDYNAISSPVTIPAGSSSVVVTIKTINDTTVEGSESVSLSITPDSTYAIAQSPATVFITDNDTPPFSTQIAWTTVAPAAVGRGEAQSAVFDNRLYLFGGYTDFSATNSTRSDYYEPATNTWHTVAAMPTGVSHGGTATVGRNVYIAGGYTGGPGGSQTFATSQVQVYNVDTNTWSTIASLPQARGGGAMAAVGNVLHFFGGADLSRTDRSEHWAFDITNPGAGWVAKAAIPTARTHMGAVGLNGKVYAVGGQQNQDAAESPQSALQVYDPSTNAWTSLAPLPLGRSHIASATIVVNNRIVTLGGETTFQNAINNVTSYDPATNTWTELTPIPANRASGVAAFINGNYYYTTGDVTSVTYKGMPG
jgi:N-acetylneuraminic acid mutarotase